MSKLITSVHTTQTHPCKPHKQHKQCILHHTYIKRELMHVYCTSYTHMCGQIARHALRSHRQQEECEECEDWDYDRYQLHKLKKQFLSLKRPTVTLLTLVHKIHTQKVYVVHKKQLNRRSLRRNRQETSEQRKRLNCE